MLRLPTHSDGPTRIASRTRTQGTTGTALTIFDGERDLDDLGVAIVDGWGPTDTCVTFRADGLLCLPIDLKLARGKALFLLSLPCDIRTCETNQIDAKIL